MAHIMTYLLEDKPNDKPSQIVLFHCNRGKRAWFRALKGMELKIHMALLTLHIHGVKPPWGSSLEWEFQVGPVPALARNVHSSKYSCSDSLGGQAQGVKLGCWSRGIPELMLSGQQWVGETELHIYGFMVTAFQVFSEWLEEWLRPITCSFWPLANPQHKSVLLWVLNRTWNRNPGIWDPLPETSAAQRSLNGEGGVQCPGFRNLRRHWQKFGK